MADNGTRVTRRKLSDYKPDPHNANKGTERGVYMLDRSIEEVGLARSIVAAADGTIPAGNKTLQAAADAGIEAVIEVETDGRALVVVKRTDWETADAEQARKYAYYDNRAAEVGLEWDAEQLLADLDAGLDLSALFFDWELEKFQLAPENEVDFAEMWEGMPEYESEDERPAYAIKVNFKTLDDLKDFARLIGQNLTEQTRSIWHPVKLPEKTKDIAWVSDEH